MRALTQYLKALADPTRLRLVLALQDGELCVCQLNTLFPLSPSTLSRHLAALERAGLVQSRKEGRWVYFALPRRGLAPAARQLLRWAMHHAARDPQAREDARHLRQCRRSGQKPVCPPAP
ncbi:metalloregulator ArsR/SmtB family transcription factor [Fontisphaera persica]|uniref:ArsR/SmtB family transcription factor n=1 Tax=Fontisphaera persica TaxID=2974023 RepID=UPI0024C0B6FB|nr:metalloregulator ArsR/SmtB family transcription factor [Fontisphaera persica]WCJ57839.1 metalloregulator ArsR/SmtB family transcription factor [Fontisphaera persica]